MIPKKIHYCWFGANEKSKLAKKCINSWKRYCPDYEIIEWNEYNFDINANVYTRKCYEQKKYAFLTDYVRLEVVYKFGGIYFDTDVEVVKSFDDLLDCEAFFGFENEDYVATGLGFGAQASNAAVKTMLEEYNALMHDEHELVSCPTLNTQALRKIGFKLNGKKQEIQGVFLYPIEFFNPFNDETGRLIKTENTYSIHWFAKSWLDKRTILKSKITRPFHRFFGKDCFAWLKRQ